MGRFPRSTKWVFDVLLADRCGVTSARELDERLQDPGNRPRRAE